MSNPERSFTSAPVPCMAVVKDYRSNPYDSAEEERYNQALIDYMMDIAPEPPKMFTGLTPKRHKKMSMKLPQMARGANGPVRKTVADTVAQVVAMHLPSVCISIERIVLSDNGRGRWYLHFISRKKKATWPGSFDPGCEDEPRRQFLKIVNDEILKRGGA